MSDKRTASTPENILQGSDEVLSKLFQVNKARKKLDCLVQQCLPDALSQKVSVVTVTQGTLRLACPNNHWAAKLRLHKSNLLSQLRQQPVFSGLSNIDITVRPEDDFKEAITEPKPRDFTLDQNNSSAIQEWAKECEDPKLAKALQNFLSHHGKGKKK